VSAPGSEADLEITAEDVRREHMGDVNATAHRLYLGGVLAGASLLMLGLLVLLDGLM
jgi:hypothetical protein